MISYNVNFVSSLGLEGLIASIEQYLCIFEITKNFIVILFENYKEKTK